MDLKNKKVPIPRIIYKILKFAEGRNEFNVIFVIHNDPVFNEKNHICPSVPGDRWYKELHESWKFVENLVTDYGRSILVL